ncbi:hypothetical protein ACFLZB_00740 [Nanoarchaeota archaeon]
MDSDVLYLRRICSGLRKRLPSRGAYDIVRRLAVAFRVRTDSYRLKAIARDKSNKPKSKKIKPGSKPSLMTPRKSLSSLIGVKLKSWNPVFNFQEKKTAVYNLFQDYAKPVIDKVYMGISQSSKDYLGSFTNFSLETKTTYQDEEKTPKKPEEEPQKPNNTLSKIIEKEINKSYQVFADSELEDLAFSPCY